MAKHLTRENRFYIETRLSLGDRPASIARELKRSRSTITREIKRNTDPSFRFYSGLLANNIVNDRLTKTIRKEKVIPNLPANVLTKLDYEISERTSPKQISAILAKEYGINISHQSIYAYIWDDKANGGKKHLGLRRKGKRWHHKNKEAKPVITDKKSIEVRPKRLALLFAGIGHWEIDTIFGLDQKSFLLTMVDISSMYTIIRKIPNKEAATVEAAIHAIIAETGIVIKSITSDNGGEFANHAILSKQYDFDWYFCHPFCSGERGLNENTNGLVRDFLPKRTDFRLYTDADIRKIQNNLNNRPRERLGFMRPVEVFMDFLLGEAA